MNALQSCKHLLASWLLDAPRYGFPLRMPGLAKRLGRSWVDLHNRHQRAILRPGQRGIALAEPWTSALFYCQKYPKVGQHLLQLALAEWPIEMRDKPVVKSSETPVVSFIIGHRGQARIPHLLAALASIAGQREIPVECLVVEQAAIPELRNSLPGWVRHLHTPLPYPEMPYSRAWAFNLGARHAKGSYLVFHDNDICVPTLYARELVTVFQQGFDAARLQRFVFYLSEPHTQAIFANGVLSVDYPPLEVVQNCQGHTLAVEREIYFEVGGHDEAFLGWGGEDNEMFDRLRSRRLHDCAYLPFLHLYHAPQPGKAAVHPNTAYFETRMRVPVAQRIAELCQRGFGRDEGPVLAREPALSPTVVG